MYITQPQGFIVIGSSNNKMLYGFKWELGVFIFALVVT